MKKKNLITLATVGAIAIGGLIMKVNHDRNNDAVIVLASGARQRHYVSPLVGGKSLKIKKGEPLDISYWAGDKDGLKKVNIYLGEELIKEDEDLDDYEFGLAGCMTRHPDLEPGKYDVRIVGIDKTGQERTDVAKLTVLNEEYKP